MFDSLLIDEVARRTGLSARALRFYEARGLVSPTRTASGRRLFAPADLARIHQIVTLKRAGLSLSAIKRLLAGHKVALEPLMRAQLGSIEEQMSELAEAACLLRTALSRIEGGEPLDAATLCSLIRNGDRIMTDKQRWDDLTGRYLDEGIQQDFEASYRKLPADFDAQDYAERWRELGSRIKAALPLDPGSEAAQRFVAEWRALLEPFAKVATPAMMQGVARMYDAMPEWGEGAPDPGFDHEVWTFIKQAGAAQRSD